MPRRAVLGQFRLFDYDVLSADDIIGTVYVHCNSLYEAGEQGKEKARRRQIHGWFPVYDTMRGICGELQVTVYIQHIMDFNPVEDSAVGVKVLSSSVPPSNYIVTELFGLVDELLVEDDPEYNWQDSFRSSRSSNDARQLLFLVMDGKLRRQIGRKVTDSGGNALLGYQTHFDLEDNFIVARGIGTCVSLAPVLTPVLRTRAGSRTLFCRRPVLRRPFFKPLKPAASPSAAPARAQHGGACEARLTRRRAPGDCLDCAAAWRAGDACARALRLQHAHHSCCASHHVSDTLGQAHDGGRLPVPQGARAPAAGASAHAAPLQDETTSARRCGSRRCRYSRCRSFLRVCFATWGGWWRRAV